MAMHKNEATIMEGKQGVRPVVKSVKLSLCLTKYYAMKTYGGMAV
jgi:hypothetical protein